MKKNKKNKPLITPLGYEVQFCKKLDPDMKKIKRKIKKIKILKGTARQQYFENLELIKWDRYPTEYY